jgi:hypothetical protein
MHGSGRGTAPPPGIRRDPSADALAATYLDPFASGSDDRSIFDDEYGPEVTATFGSTCDAHHCTQGGTIFEGDTIRADGDDGWVHTECAED